MNSRSLTSVYFFSFEVTMQLVMFPENPQTNAWSPVSVLIPGNFMEKLLKSAAIADSVNANKLLGQTHTTDRAAVIEN